MRNTSRREILKQGLLLTGGATLCQEGFSAPATPCEDQGTSPKVFNIEPLSDVDKKYLKRAIEIAEMGTQPESGSNYPYGALIRFENGDTFEAWNTVAKHGDPTRHAEMTLLTKVFAQGMDWQRDRGRLKKATIYASAEPCFMCAGAIFWSGIGRVVYGISAAQLDEIYKEYFPDTEHSQIPASAMGSLAAVGIDINGPHLIEQSSEIMHHNIRSQLGKDNPFKK